jgi:hypothetical protein
MPGRKQRPSPGALHGGIPKEKRWSWKVLDKKGAFCWIAKERLLIDHTYQRDKISQERVTEYAAQWSWVLCGALSIVRRDGKYYVVDGQNRKLAADKRTDITELPCMAFASITTIEEEAAAFVALNTRKTAVNSVDKFKALLVAKDVDAVGLNAVIESTGHRIAAGGGQSGQKTVGCVLTLLRLYRRDQAVFARLWPLLSDMCVGTSVTDSLVDGIWGAELRAAEKKLSLVNPPLRDALLRAGGEVMKTVIMRGCAIDGHGGPLVKAASVIKWINKQRLGAKAKI